MRLIFKLIFCIFLLNATLAYTASGNNRGGGGGITVTTVINSDVFTCNGAATAGGGQTGSGGAGGTGGTGSDTSQSNTEVTSDTSAAIKQFKIAYKENRINLCGGGMANYRVVDSQITASSVWPDRDIHLPKYARLYTRDSPLGGSWIPRSPQIDSWIQVEYAEEKEVFGVVTQGRGVAAHYVTTYRVSYKPLNSDEFLDVLDANGKAEIFEGNSDADTPVIAEFNEPVNAKVVRMRPLAFHVYAALRFDVLLC